LILFFYGPNDFLLKRKLRDLKDKYQTASKGSFDLVTLEGEGLSLESFTSQVQTMALFAATRLIVINQIFDAHKEVQNEIKEYLPSISQSAVVVFVHVGEPDKRFSLFKALNKPKISQYFTKIESGELNRFTLDLATSYGGKFENGALSYLIESVGSDLWQISNEVEKLTTYKGNLPITREDIDLLVSKNLFANAFALADAMTSGDKTRAFRELDALISSGEMPLKILGAINYQFRLIALIKDELEQNHSSYEIAGRLKIRPFQVQKAIGFAKTVSWQELSKIYELLLAMDESAKTGKIEPEEALKELVLEV